MFPWFYTVNHIDHLLRSCLCWRENTPSERMCWVFPQMFCRFRGLSRIWMLGSSLVSHRLANSINVTRTITFVNNLVGPVSVFVFVVKDVRAKISNIDFFRDFQHLKLMTYWCQKCKKNGGSPTSFRREQAWKNTLNLKNRASLANKTTVSVSLKIMQLDNDKYCSSGPIKWI